MNESLFKPFPKIGRLTRECVITEKIDGTNAQVFIVETMDPCSADYALAIAKRARPDSSGRWQIMFAGSRTRYLTPDSDNLGFAQWVQGHTEELFELGPGRHFGEWWGGKVQRGYGLTEKRFSLFNTVRWCAADTEPRCVNENDPNPKCVPQYQKRVPPCCSVVPELYRGLFGDRVVDNILAKLKAEGSMAAPGFMRPEGVVVYHTATGVLFKKLIENDEVAKGQVAA